MSEEYEGGLSHQEKKALDEYFQWLDMLYPAERRQYYKNQQNSKQTVSTRRDDFEQGGE